MNLNRPAQHNFRTEFEMLNLDDTWSDWSVGRLSVVDRFLSNFHRPLQRRMLHSRPDVPLPATGVVRNKVTGEVFLLGQTRTDDENGEAYARLTVAHLASNLSSGMGTLYRKVVDNARPAATIGELVDSTVGNLYCSIEYKNAYEAEITDGVYVTQFVLFASRLTELELDDVITLNGVSYVVHSPRYDSDLVSCVVIRKDDERITATYKQPAAGYGYDPASGVVTRAFDDYLVTCTVTKTEATARIRGELYQAEIFLKSPSFPLTPGTGDLVVAEGETYRIVQVEKSHNAGYQWRLLCDWTHL